MLENTTIPSSLPKGGDSLHNQQKIHKDQEDGEMKTCNRLVTTKVVPANHQAGTSESDRKNLLLHFGV
jgi:hypothetical protein